MRKLLKRESATFFGDRNIGNSIKINGLAFVGGAAKVADSYEFGISEIHN
jgi:hypothetical protein